MPRRRSSRRGAANLSGVLPGILLLTFAIVAGSALAYFYFSAPQKPVLDAATLCPVSGPAGLIVVLVDTSDDLADATRREVAVILDDLTKALPEYYKLDIRVLDIPTTRSRSLFARCNPGDGAGLSEWTENPRIARMRWIESFRQPASDAIRNSLAPAKAASSPIMAAIQDIAIDEFSSAEAQRIKKTLIVISDMLEYTRTIVSTYARAICRSSATSPLQHI